MKLVRGRVAGRGVDGGPAPPQRVEPRHEGGVVFEAARAKVKSVILLECFHIRKFNYYLVWRK